VLDYLEGGTRAAVNTQDEIDTAVDADILPDGRVTPRGFTWQGERRLVTNIGRQWVEGQRRHVLVSTESGDTFELAVTMPAMGWTGRVVSQRAKVV